MTIRNGPSLLRTLRPRIAIRLVELPETMTLNIDRLISIDIRQTPCLFPTHHPGILCNIQPKLSQQPRIPPLSTNPLSHQFLASPFSLFSISARLFNQLKYPCHPTCTVPAKTALNSIGTSQKFSVITAGQTFTLV